MANRKEYEMLFRLGAQMNGEFTRTFRAAQSELSATQKEIQALGRTQADISAYQKQQAAIDNTKKKLEVLQQQYDNIQKEISETGTYSSDLENKLLSKQQQIEKTSDALGRQTQRLDELGTALHEAGVDTSNLGQESTRLGKKIDELAEQERQAADGAEDFGDRSTEALEAVQSALAALGITKLLHAIYDEFRACVDASVEFESAMTGVAKTTDLTDAEFAAMSDAVQELSTEIPATTTELAAIAETAGQLGIEKNSLLDFTEVMAMLGTATNMTSEEAATMLAQFASITGMDPKLYSNLGSAIVDLGNNFATTEKNIADMSQTIAAAGSIAGMSEADIVGIAAAVTSLGISAQNGGTQMTKLISEINSAVSSGEGLEEWASVAGMSADAFAQAWGNDAANALDAFIIGLNGAYSSGQDVYGILSDLGITETRMVTMITSLAKSGTRLTDTLNVSNQAWVKNTALTGEAEKRYATTESKLTLMQNAYNNLKVAVGDNYTPALQKLYEIGTKVLKNITDFVTAHPGAVKAITILVATVGGYVAALTAYVVIAKLAKIAQDLLNASMLANPFVLAATAIIGVTAALFALASSAEDTVPSVYELNEATREATAAMDEAKANFEETAEATIATANVADIYISKLEEMEAAGISTDEQAREYHNTLALLCQAVPELAQYIDLQTDTIQGGTDALRANTAAWKENAIQQAYQDELTEMTKQYANILVDAEKKSIELTKAQIDLENKTQAFNDATARMDELWQQAAVKARELSESYGLMGDASAYVTEEYWELQKSLPDLSKEVYDAQQTVDNYTESIQDSQEAADAAKEQIALEQEAIDNLTGAVDDSADSSAELAAQQQEVAAAVDEMLTPLEELTKAYTDAYEAAQQSISGQYALWDEAADVVATSASSINDALSGQIEYWQDYNANLSSLRDRAADIEGLSDVIASFADGSADGVNAVAGMAAASDEDLQTMVANWQTLQAEQDATSASIAELKTDFSAQMDELESDFEQTISNMDLSKEAASSAASTIQAFIDQADIMLPNVQSAYQRLADAATSALASASAGNPTPQKVGQNATGTRSAGDIFIAGEEGPELIVGQRGASVFPAQETQRIIEALPNSGNGGGNVTEIRFAPVYHLDGATNAADLETVLRNHDEEMRDYIMQVLNEAGVDANRRAYV